MFTERKIKGLMEKGEASRSFSAIGGWKGLKYSVRSPYIIINTKILIVFLRDNYFSHNYFNVF